MRPPQDDENGLIMRPDIVTFWHGPLDALRLTCLKSQVAAGHKVTVYSFEPLAGLPDGVGNAEAEAVLPRDFAERLRPTGPDGVWRDWTILQFSDFFRMRLMARSEGLWLDADVLLLKPVEIDPAKPFFAWERRHQLGNSVLYLPSHHPIVTAFEELMEQDDLTPDWLALRHRLTFMMRQLRRRSNRLADIRIAIYGPASLTALARRSRRVAPRAAEEVILCGACRTETVFRAVGFFSADRGPGSMGLARLAQRPRQGEAIAWQFVCVGGGAGGNAVRINAPSRRSHLRSRSCAWPYRRATAPPCGHRAGLRPARHSPAARTPR